MTQKDSVCEFLHSVLEDKTRSPESTTTVKPKTKPKTKTKSKVKEVPLDKEKYPF